VGSFVVQAHVGYLGVVGVLVLGALGSVVVAARRGRRTVPVLLAAAAVAGVLWVLPVIEQVTTDPGNLGLVLKFAREGEGPAHPLGDGWHVVSDALGWRFAWAAGLPEPNLFTGSVPLDGGAPVPLGLVALGAATAVAAWRRAYSAVRLDVTVLVALAAAVVSVSRISGEIFPYLVTWVAGLAMLAWIAAAWSLWRALPASGRTRLRGPAAVAVGAGLVVAAAAASFDAVDVDVRDRVEAEATRQLSGPARAALGDGDHPVLVDALGGFRPQGVAAALVLHLEREGIPVEVPRPISHPYGKHRRSDGGPTRAALLVSPRALLGELRDPSRWELVARWDSARSTTLFLAGDDHLGLYRRRAPARSPAGPLAEPE
jgi:hypothetical protein